MQRKTTPTPTEITLRALRAHPEERSPILAMAETVFVHAYSGTNATGEFHIAFGIGDGMVLTEVAAAVLERTSLHAGPRARLFVQLVDRRDGAARRVTQTLRDAAPGELIFVGFGDSILYDAGMAALYTDPAITVFDPEGSPMGKLTAADRMAIRKAAAEVTGGMPAPRTPAPLRQKVFRAKLHDRERLVGVALTAGPATARNIDQIADRIGGGRIIVVEVLRPTNGFDGRSSVSASEALADGRDDQVIAIVHAAADLATYQSIVAEFEAQGWPLARRVTGRSAVEIEIVRAGWT